LLLTDGYASRGINPLDQLIDLARGKGARHQEELRPGPRDPSATVGAGRRAVRASARGV